MINISREELLRYVFLDMVHHGEWASPLYHDFCRWAKWESNESLAEQIGLTVDQIADTVRSERLGPRRGRHQPYRQAAYRQAAHAVL
jgi:hypothetical protein